MGDLVTTAMEKAEVLNNFLPHFSLVIALPTFLESQNLSAETEGIKSHSSKLPEKPEYT